MSTIKLTEEEKNNVLKIIRSEKKKGRTFVKFHYMAVIGLFDNQLKSLIEFLRPLAIDVKYREEWVDVGDRGFEMHPRDIVIDWCSKELIEANQHLLHHNN